MIKKKVLKFTVSIQSISMSVITVIESFIGTIQAVESQIAVEGNSASLAASQKEVSAKLATNIKIEQGSAGERSKSVTFTCP